MGLSVPFRSCSPRKSSSYRNWARYRRYGKGTWKCSASAGPGPINEDENPFEYTHDTCTYSLAHHCLVHESERSLPRVNFPYPRSNQASKCSQDMSSRYLMDDLLAEALLSFPEDDCMVNGQLREFGVSGPFEWHNPTSQIS